MQILLVTHYFEPDSGAAAVRLSRLARLLMQRGHEVTVLTTMPHYPQGQIAAPYRGKRSAVEERDGLRIVRAWLWATPSSKISRRLISQWSFMFSAAWCGLALPRPDVVLIEAQPMFTSLAGVFLSRLKHVPYVLNVSDLWPDHLLSVGTLAETHPVYRLLRWLVDSTYRGAAGIVAMSPAWAEAITQRIGQRGTTRIIYNGVDLERFRPGIDATDFRQKHHLGNYRLVTFIGTLATQYDIGGMIAVAQRLAGRDDVRFVFVGSGSQNLALKCGLEQTGMSNIRWINWIDHSEIPQAWAASDVTYWVMRNQDLYRGTIPAKLYEALASGVPIAAATEGVAAQIIAASGAGETVRFGDLDGLATAITRLLDNPGLRQQYSQTGRAYAEQHFDPEKVAAAYEAILSQAIPIERRSQPYC